MPASMSTVMATMDDVYHQGLTISRAIFCWPILIWRVTVNRERVPDPGSEEKDDTNAGYAQLRLLRSRYSSASSFETKKATGSLMSSSPQPHLPRTFQTVQTTPMGGMDSRHGPIS